MKADLRQLVWDRAGACCEYCHLPQAALEQTLHVEHIVSRQHLGPTDESNLALACDRCNLYKGPNLTAIDPESGAVVMLFHPRRDVWETHFRLRGTRIEGLTPTGRATVRLLNMNDENRQRIREWL